MMFIVAIHDIILQIQYSPIPRTARGKKIKLTMHKAYTKIEIIFLSSCNVTDDELIYFIFSLLFNSLFFL
jgi:hypothetical protein